MQGEKRKAPRKHLKYPARILNGDDEPRMCTLSDISATGARVITSKPEGLPDEIMLLLSNGGARRRCRIAWRDGQELGLEFMHDFDKPKSQPKARS
jgi:hypothetical protein